MRLIPKAHIAFAFVTLIAFASCDFAANGTTGPSNANNDTANAPTVDDDNDLPAPTDATSTSGDDDDDTTSTSCAFGGYGCPVPGRDYNRVP